MRLTRTAYGRAPLTLKTEWSDGTMALLFAWELATDGAACTGLLVGGSTEESWAAVTERIGCRRAWCEGRRHADDGLLVNSRIEYKCGVETLP